MSDVSSLLIFDLDGTLMDSSGDLRAAVNAMRASYDLPPLDQATVTGYVGDGLRNLVRRSLQGHPADPDEALARCAAYYSEHLTDHTTLYPGVEEGLRTLHAHGFTLALCSNKPARWCRDLVAHFGFTSLFRTVAGGDSAPHLKPHPAPVQAILAQAGASPGDSWMIGDSRNDLAVADAAGLRSIFVTYGYGRCDGLRPDFQADTFPEVVAFLCAQP